MLAETKRVSRKALKLCLLAAVAALPALSQAVGIGFNPTGLGSLTYNGTEFLDYGDLRLHSIIFANGSSGSTSSTVVVDPVAQTQTRTFSWGSMVLNYSASGNRLTVSVTVNNQTSLAIRQIWFEPLGLKFPSSPWEFDNGFPLLRHTLSQTALQSMSYSGGAMVLAADDVTKPLLIGFPYATDGAKTHFPLTLNTDRVASYADSYPTINRPIPAGASDEFRFSFRFGGVSDTGSTLAQDVLHNFALAHPSTFNWADRRPVAQLILSTAAAHFPTNPRGWLFDPQIDVTTPAGIANFRQRILEYAHYSAAILQSMNAQGGITWDIEGQEFPHSFSYIGDPRLTTTLAPEMSGVVDEYFAIFRDAGLRVGVTLRPQQFVFSPMQQNSINDPAQLLQMMADKVNYAKNHWNATMFYIDSNVNEFDPNPIDPALFQSLTVMFPDVLFIAEHSTMQYYAHVAGYKELREGYTSTHPDIRVAYPNALTFIYVPNGDPSAYAGRLADAFKQGDSFLFRGWYPDPLNDQLRQIYLNAFPGIAVTVVPQVWSLRQGQTRQFTASVAGTPNSGVTWKIVPDGFGTISPSGLYTAPAVITQNQNILLQAVSAADPAKSGVASVSLVEGVAISLSPANASLGAGQTQQFTATVEGAANTDVTWSLTGSGTISTSGLYAAPANIAVGESVTVKATSVADATKSADATITLTPAVSISISPPTVTLSANQVRQFTATINGSANTSLTWSLTGAGTLSPSGLYTAPSSIDAPATATITATSVADTTKSANATVTLSPTVTISVTPQTVTLIANQTQQFTATVSGSTDPTVTWSLSGAGTLSASGLYTAPASISASSSATVTATSAADPTKSAAVTVTLSPTVAIAVAPLAATLTVSQTQQFAATVTGSANTGVTWTLTGAGTISNAGLYTAPASINASANVTVTATSAVDPTKSANVTVTLSPIAISVGPPSVSLAASQTQQFTAAVTGSPNTSATWSLTGPGTVSASGLYTAPASIAPGQTATVRAVSNADISKAANASVTLLPEVAVTVGPVSVSLGASQSQQFTAAVSGSRNTTVTWSVIGSGTISASGLYAAPGTIHATEAVTVKATSVADPTKFATGIVNLTLPQPSFANGYAYRRTITIDHTRVPNTDQTNFPVLITGVYPALATVGNGGHVQSPNGFDIVFTSDNAGANALNWELESFNGATGAVTFWVRMPVLSHTTDSQIYMFYGKAGVAAFQGNRAGTWDNNYVAVYHMADNAASNAVLDSTTNGNTGAAQSATNAKTVVGRIDGAQTFNGISDFILANNSNSLAITGNLTIEAWVKANAMPGLGNQLYIAGKGYNGSNEGYFLRLETNNSGNSFLQAGTSSFPNAYQAQVQVNGFAGSWHHVLGSYNGTWSVYVDGVGTASSQSVPPLHTGEPVAIGARDTTGARVYFLNGAIDEVRISTIARTSDWVAASFENQNSPATFFVLGPELSSGGPAPVEVSVAPPTVTLNANQTQQFAGSVTGSANTAVTWTLTGAGTLSEGGLYTAPPIINAQATATVTATSAADPTKSANATVTLAPIVAVSVGPQAATMSASQTQQFTATITGSPNPAVTWNLTGPGTLSAAGLYTAPASISNSDSATVTATSVADPAKSASAAVTLAPSVGVSVSPPAITLSINQTQQFAATVTGSANPAVTWSLTGAGTLSSSGLYTAPATINASATATVTATSVADGTKLANATVTLSPVAVGVGPASATLSPTQTQQFTATVTGSANTAVTWSLTGSGSISAAGLYTAPANISAAETVIVKATSATDPTKSATGSVNLVLTPLTFSNGYSYRRAITLDHNRVPNTDQINFPVLVSGVYPSLATVANGGRVQSQNGFDILFTSDSTGSNPLNFELESYNGTTGAIAFWVRVPVLSHTADSLIYMFYGKGGVASFQGNRSSTWDSNYVAVYHLADSAASNAVSDSTSNGNSAAAQAFTNTKTTLGRIAGAQTLNGANDFINATNNSSLAITGNVTIEAWVKANAMPSLGNQAYIAGKGYNGSNEGYFLRLETNNSGTSFVQAGTFAFPASYQAQVQVSGFAGAWHHVVGSFNGTWSVYVDGVRTGSSQTLGPLHTGEPAVLGARGANGSRVSFLNGVIDEVRISNAARSADWVVSSFNSQSRSDTFAIVGPEASSP